MNINMFKDTMIIYLKNLLIMHKYLNLDFFTFNSVVEDK